MLEFTYARVSLGFRLGLVLSRIGCIWKTLVVQLSFTRVLIGFHVGFTWLLGPRCSSETFCMAFLVWMALLSRVAVAAVVSVGALGVFVALSVDVAVADSGFLGSCYCYCFSCAAVAAAADAAAAEACDVATNSNFCKRVIIQSCWPQHEERGRGSIADLHLHQQQPIHLQLHSKA
jgi:hypothetical protein